MFSLICCSCLIHDVCESLLWRFRLCRCIHYAVSRIQMQPCLPYPLPESTPVGIWIKWHILYLRIHPIFIDIYTVCVKPVVEMYTGSKVNLSVRIINFSCYILWQLAKAIFICVIWVVCYILISLMLCDGISLLLQKQMWLCCPWQEVEMILFSNKLNQN